MEEHPPPPEEPRTRITSRALVHAGTRLAYLLPAYAWVLVVHAAVPGWLAPPMGIPTWTTGFGLSLARADHWSIHAHDIGLPEPAAISFGLPGALMTALGFEAGLSSPDAAALALAFWLAVSFWGACALGRQLGASHVVRALGATVWLTFPVVWMHGNYSMLSVGIALLPTYFHAALALLDGRRRWYVAAPVFLLFALVSSFMDGYTFVMFASASLAFAVAALAREGFSKVLAARITLLLLGFGVSFMAYSRYMPAHEFTAEPSFFRAFGLDLSFLLSPPQGLLWLPDLLRISTPRTPEQWFGDPSGYDTTFAVVPLVLAAALLVVRLGDRRAKVVFFAIAVIALYLSLGPSFKFFSTRPPGASNYAMSAAEALAPTGTGFLWENVPGLTSMRAVYRWTALGVAGLWMTIMVALAAAQARRWSVLVLGLLLAVNAPHLGLKIDWGERGRQELLAAEAELSRYRRHFRPDERVAFLPAGNDFLVTWFAPLIDIRTYNIGGDKNVALAMPGWPEELAPFRSPLPAGPFAAQALRALSSGVLDTVAIPKIDLLHAAHGWPPERVSANRYRPYVRLLRGTGLVEMTQTPHFALLRLVPGADVAASTLSELEAPVPSCAESDEPPAIVLRPSQQRAFAQLVPPCHAGWSYSEPWGRWTDGKHASLRLQLTPAPYPQTLEIAAVGYLGASATEQRIGVQIDARTLPDWVFTPSRPRGLQEIKIPPGTTRVSLKFAIPGAVSPLESGESIDSRRLGLGIEQICLARAGERCLNTQ